MAVSSSALTLVSFDPPQKTAVLKSLPAQTSIASQSLGSWIQNCPSGASPALDQPTMLSNNITLTLTYGFNHVGLGASLFAGFHSIVGFAPQALPAQQSYWQQYADSSNNFLYLVPPTTLTTGSGTQLLCNTSPLGLENGSFWSYTISGSTYSILVSVFCPFGGALVMVFVTVDYTGVTASSVVTVPLNNASGTQTNFGVPFSGTGYTNTISGGVWILVNNTSPTTAASATVYNDAIGVPIGSASSTYIVGAQFMFLGQ